MATTFLDLLRVKVAIQLGVLDAAGAVAGLKAVDANGGGAALLEFLGTQRSLPAHTVERIDRHARRCEAIKGESVYLRFLRARNVVDEKALQPIMWEVRAQKDGPGLGETCVSRGLLPAALHAEIQAQTQATMDHESSTTAGRYRERGYAGVERVSPVIAQLIQEESQQAARPVAPSPPPPTTAPPLARPRAMPGVEPSSGEGTMVLDEQHASGAAPLPGGLGGTGSGDTGRVGGKAPIVLEGEATDDSIPRPDTPPLPPQLANTGLDKKYAVLRKLGEGGMGVVFLAYALDDARRETPMALKVVLDLAKSADAAARFKREILATSMCGHPNIIEIYDASETDDGSYYMAMEYLEGEELSDILKRERQIDLKRVVTLMEQALDAMEAMHQANIVHRDIKPHNFRITHDESGTELLKVVDFGIARILDLDSAGLGDQIFTTMAGKITGSPAYIAPESITEPNIDARADLYSLGITIFRIATGRLPFVAREPTEYLPMHLYNKPPPLRSVLPEAPEQLEAMIGKLLEKIPSKRFQSAGEALEFLKTEVRPAVFQETPPPPQVVPINPFAAAPGARVPGTPVPAAMAATGQTPGGADDLGFSWQDQDPSALGFTSPGMIAAKVSAGQVAVGEGTVETPAPNDPLPGQPAPAAAPEPEAKPGFFVRMWRAVFGEPKAKA